MKIKHCLVVTLASLCFSCAQKAGDTKNTNASEATFINPLFQEGADPRAIFYEGKYYYTHGTEDRILLWETTDITNMKQAVCKEVWLPKDPECSYHIWTPEMHRIGNKWYIYFAADDGNTDNHQLYVLENSSPDPMQGVFEKKGPIVTNSEWNWGIQATTFEHKQQHYLLWSGWPKRRTDSETQCIYIARMKNPWTLDSERVMLSTPEYEWERQWVNPDGSRTAYPIYVNENPRFFRSKDHQTAIIYYSASGCWSPYYCVGMLTADADSDLLDAASWKKSPMPVFSQSPQDSVFGPGSIDFIPSPDGTEWWMLYQARNIPNGDAGGPESRNPRIQKIGWDKNGMPDLGKPVPADKPLVKPSGTPGE